MTDFQEVIIPTTDMKSRVKRSPTTEWSIRITPSDQQAISEEEFKEKGLKDAELLIVCEEGTPNGSPKLHYHIYIKSQISRTSLERYCAKIGRANIKVKGNAVFSIKQANNGTIGYVVKDRNIVTTIGYDNTTLIEEYFELSNQYRKDLEATRRKVNRDKASSFKELFDTLESYASADDIIKYILNLCNERGMTFPSRSIMESNVLRLMYKINPEWVNAFYTRNYNVHFQ